MAAPAVRADYDHLKAMANRFSGQAQAAQKTLQSLQRELEVLQGGDWVGKGATSFYQEMGSQVMPTMRRLANALESAQQTTLQIHQIMAQAEAEAARWLHGDGEEQQALFGAGAGPAGGPVAAGPAGGGAAARPRGSANMPTAEEIARGTRQFNEAVARMLAPENAAVDQKLANFSPGVRALVKQSPTLRAQFLKMQQDNFNIHIVPLGAGFTTNWAEKKITIEQPLSDAETVASLAHEAGHAVNEPNLIQKTPGMTHDQYVGPNVRIMLRNEGQAAFNEAQVQAELIAAGGPDIGIGGQRAAYRQAYEDYVAGNLTRDQVMERMSTMMASEVSSIPPHENYRDMYRRFFEMEWDTSLDPPPMR